MENVGGLYAKTKRQYILKVKALPDRQRTFHNLSIMTYSTPTLQLSPVIKGNTVYHLQRVSSETKFCKNTIPYVFLFFKQKSL